MKKLSKAIWMIHSKAIYPRLYATNLVSIGKKVPTE